jgi:hypothetical protein
MKSCRAWWHTSIIPALRRQEDSKFKVSLGYPGKLCLQKNSSHCDLLSTLSVRALLPSPFMWDREDCSVNWVEGEVPACCGVLVQGGTGLSSASRAAGSVTSREDKAVQLWVVASVPRGKETSRERALWGAGGGGGGHDYAVWLTEKGTSRGHPQSAISARLKVTSAACFQQGGENTVIY